MLALGDEICGGTRVEVAFNPPPEDGDGCCLCRPPPLDAGPHQLQLLLVDAAAVLPPVGLLAVVVFGLVVHPEGGDGAESSK